jgi:hypothetical protein
MKRRCPDFVRYVFRDYRLLVTFIVRDYGMSERREQVPLDSQALHDASV